MPMELLERIYDFTISQNLFIIQSQGIYWDDHCKWCDSNACLPNTYDYMGNSIGDGGNACAIEDRECIEGGKTVTLCELHVYVVWTGSDSRGNRLTSAAGRFSRLTRNEIFGLINRMKDSHS